MSSYLLSSAHFAGEVAFEFNEREMLVGFSMHAEMSGDQHAYLLAHLPITLHDLRQLTQISSATIVEVKKEITFVDFWNRYDDKLSSSKKRTEARWNSMSKVIQMKAYHYIYRYFNGIPSGCRKKYAETYLMSEIWDN